MKEITKYIPKMPVPAETAAPVTATKTGTSGAIRVVSKPDSEASPFTTLISQFLNAGRANGLSPQTLRDYESKLVKFQWWWEKYHAERLGNHPRNVTLQEARAWAAYLREPSIQRFGEPVVRDIQELAPSTIQSYGRNVKIWFAWLEQEGIIDRSPFNRSVSFSTRNKQQKVIKVLEDSDLVRIFQALSGRGQTFAGSRNLAMVALLAESGMRRGELLGMKLSDVSLEQGHCLISGKTGQRWCYFTEFTRNCLHAYLSGWRWPLEQQKITGLIPVQHSAAPLWVVEDGSPIAYHTLSSIIKQVEKLSGVELHAHLFRHTLATSAVAKVSIYEVQKLLGHKSVKTTEIYTHTNREQLEATYRSNAVSPLQRLSGEQIGLSRRRGRPPANRGAK